MSTDGLSPAANDTSASHPLNKSFAIEYLLRDEIHGNTNTTKEEKPQKRRQRSSFSAVQVHFLEVEFRKQRYISPESRARLSSTLGLTQQQIKIWFQNRRYKSKPKSFNEQSFQYDRTAGNPQMLFAEDIAHREWIPEANLQWLNVYYFNMFCQSSLRAKLQ
ncbi:hypothetical protein QR680_002153 [Steinernema hermaphroditum]|uniref:Homeobox domain-containing protein n=1 Tax=Steinernema hermaphroditum TaxID=289476 RepID=A0AA39LHK6_9BILA|nr:hypothetical protein QR680_002153 [Steinernema hermaphroditum]